MSINLRKQTNKYNMESKLTHLQKWLAANPGKTDRDWLLEVRCVDDSDRALRDKDFITEELKRMNSTR